MLDRGKTLASADVVKPPVLALDPDVIGPMAQEAAQVLLRDGESENTVRSYQTALRYWSGWFWLRYHRPIALPVSEATVVQFIVDHAQRSSGAGEVTTELPAELDAELVRAGFKAALGAPALATLQHRISVLSKVHQLQSAPNPCESASVRELLARTRRAYAKRGVKPKKQAAATKDVLEALLETCDDSLAGIRNRALLLFAWSSGGRRRSEVTTARVEDLTRQQDGSFAFKLARSKTDQAGDDAAGGDKPLVGSAALALDRWLLRSGITSGFIFRRIRRGGKLAEALSPAAVRDIVKARAGAAGLEGDYSAHSLRSGFVTEAAHRSVPIAETMALTGHTSVATVIGYFRTADALKSGAARLFDDS
jgi:integrase